VTGQTKNDINVTLSKPVKVPTILQMEMVECGAASLSMILSFYGKFIPLEELRLTCGVTRDGSNAKNLLRAARSYGLKAKGFAMNIELLKKSKMPCILFWNFNHFLVLEGFKTETVHINDPAHGRYTISYKELEESYTGVCFTFEPDEGFIKENRKPSLIAGLINRIQHSKQAIQFIVTISIFLIIPGIIIPSFTQTFVDYYLVKKMESWVMPLILTMGGILLLNALLTYVQQYYLLRLENKLSLSQSSKFFWHILKLPIEFFHQRHPGQVSNRIQMNDSVATLLSGDLANAALSVIVVIFFAIMMFFYSWILTLIGIFTVSLNVVALLMVANKRKDGFRRMVNDDGKLIGETMTGISLIETLKASGRESDFFSNWSGFLAKKINTSSQLSWLNLRLNIISPFLVSLNSTLILGIGTLLVMNGQLSMGELIAFIYLMNNFVGPVNSLVGLGSKIQEMEGNMNQIDDVLKYKTATVFNTDSQKEKVEFKEKLTGHINATNINFGYNPMGDPIISNFCLNIKPGKRIAIVGGSGSGKSTVAKLIAGLYNSWNGEISLDNIDKSKIPRNVINHSLALIDQNTFLFEGTIKENITLWDKSIPERVLVQASKDADIHDMIVSRQGGYESKLVEGGGNLSGGQRQRMDIARALASEPTILIMDEGTSALDPTSEKTVMDNIRKRGCTCVIIAHRLSTIRDCDEIIVLDKGIVKQQGTHEDLIADKAGIYYSLIMAQ
jgi:NHLM bacteriocin system ABC transporter peptidase/ATP-binding protein